MNETIDSKPEILAELHKKIQLIRTSARKPYAFAFNDVGNMWTILSPGLSRSDVRALRDRLTQVLDA